MNLCAVCHYEDGKIRDGRYMVNGTSLCNNHAHIAMNPSPKLKWTPTPEPKNKET